MTCQDCQRLQTSLEELTAENTRLQQENTELRRKPALYENPHTPPSRRAYPTRRSRGGPRFPGRPRGQQGRTRPRQRPDVVKAPEPKERCESCGAPLDKPSYVDHHIVEEISNLAPRQVIDFLEFEWTRRECGSHTVSRHPDCPPGGRLGKNALVQATLMKFQERLPLQKVCEALGRMGGEKSFAPGQFVAPHCLWKDSRGCLYVGEVLEGQRIRLLICLEKRWRGRIQPG